jgi:hypothetical protein
MKKTNVPFVLCVAAVIFLVAAFGAFLCIGHLMSARERPLGLAELERVTQVHFPPGTRILEGVMHDNHGRRRVLAKLILPASALRSLLGSVPEPKSVSIVDRGRITNSIASRYGWWDPDSLRHYVAVESDDSSRISTLQCLIGFNNAKYATAYVCWTHD